MSNRDKVQKYVGKAVNGPVYSYSEFMEWTAQLVAEKKSSGPDQSKEMVEYTALNYTRMKRLNKTAVLSEEMKEVLSVIDELTFVVITEPWCGDSAQIMPIIGKMEEAGNLNVHIVLRDENPELIDEYLTNGGRSIPKVVAFDSAGNELFTWGPRPAAAQAFFEQCRSDETMEWQQVAVALQKWYTKDKNHAAQKELLVLLNEKLVERGVNA